MDGTMTMLVRDLQSYLDSSTKLVTPDSSEYRDAISRWSDTAVKHAGIVAFPLSAKEVSKLVVFAVSQQMDLAVKCGGHSTGGNNSSDGGLVIDLSKMRNVSIDRYNKVLIAQGGCIWENVNKKADENALSVVSATVNHVGIGGSTLGGGFGWLCGIYGTVADNLVGATVVLADGKIVNTSETENEDLFWALRGAGHNFGIVIEFRFQIHRLITPNVFAGTIIFSPDKLDAIIDSLNSSTWSPNPRAASHYIIGKPHNRDPIITVHLFYNGDEKSARNHFGSILRIPSISNNLKPMTYFQANEMLTDLHKDRKSLKGATFAPPIRPEFIHWLFDEFTKKLTEEPDLSHSTFSIESYDMTQVAKVPIEKMAFPTRGHFQIGIIKLSWTDPSKDEEYRAWGRFLQNKCRDEAQEMPAQPQVHANLEYANYSEPDDLYSIKPFGANQERLEQLKAKYDPRCVFNKTNPIPPAVIQDGPVQKT